MQDGISIKLHQSKQEHTADQNPEKNNMNKESKDHISIFNLISKSDIYQ